MIVKRWRFASSHVLATVALIAASITSWPAAFAQVWPSRPVRIIVPYVPGGTIDITARLMMSKLSQTWGQPVVIDNRAGAAGTIGANLVAKSSPDGHTLLLASASELTTAQTIIKNMPFNHRITAHLQSKRIGRKLGLSIRAVELSDPLAAVDVDKPADHELVTAILEGRA